MNPLKKYSRHELALRMGRPAKGRQALLDRFIDVCNQMKPDPYDIVTASLYMCCVGVLDVMQLERDVFIDMASTFYDDLKDQRKDEADEDEAKIKEVFHVESN